MPMTVEKDSKRTPKQHKTPCHDCPWRRKSIKGWLGSLTPQAWTAKAHSEDRIKCHTLQADPIKQWECAGAAMFRANVCKVPRDPKAFRLQPNREIVFSLDKEFIAHHEKLV